MMTKRSVALVLPSTTTLAVLTATICSAATLLVPSPLYPNIAAGIDSAKTGDVVRLGPGTYTGIDNRIYFDGKAITVESAEGPENTRLDCGGSRLVLFYHGETRASVLRGITICNASTTGDGGGILCVASSPTLENVAVLGCRASSGGGVAVWSGSPLLVGCTSAGNEALDQGGGLAIGAEASVDLKSSVIWNNCAASGTDVQNNGSLGMECCVLLEGGLSGEGVVFWTDGGWIQSDPLFCAPGECSWSPTCEGTYGVAMQSVCLPENNSCGRLIGAFGLGCTPPTTVVTRSWGRVKQAYLGRGASTPTR